jgi:hypothetical protein
MFKVNADEMHQRLGDRLRNLFYPLVPVIAIGTVWAVGWARSVESRIAAQCGPLRLDSQGAVVAVKADHQSQLLQLPASANSPTVASDDDAPQD